MDADEQKALNDIEAIGCHVLHILEEDELPPFSYSIGIKKNYDLPEMIVVGLKRELAHSIINNYNERIKEGEHFQENGYYSDFIEGFEVKMEMVHKSNYRVYLGWARWLYKGNEFETLQMVYPNTSGTWPWDPEANEWFCKRQPLLKNELITEQDGAGNPDKPVSRP